MSDHLLSASQFKTFESCNRKWGFTYVEGLRQPPTASTQLGTEVHTCAEAWLSSGTFPDLKSKPGAIFAPGIEHLPKPSKDLEVESYFEFQGFRGYIDCVDLTGEIPLVIDHKTTKNPYYALTPEKLRRDVQAIVYAASIFDRVPNASSLLLRWVYYRTTTPQAFKVEVKVSRSEIDTAFNDILERSRSVSILREISTDARGIPRNLNHCNAFGGCPFKDRCDNYGEEEKMSDIFEKLKKASQKQQQPEVVAKGVNPPDSNEPEIVAAEPVVEEKPKRKRGRPKKVKEPAPQPAPVVTSEPEASQQTDSSWFNLYVGCLPVGERVRNLETVLLEVAERAATKHGLAHYKLAEYGKGSAYLVEAFKEYIDEEPLDGSFYVDSKSRIFQELQDELTARAVRVVRATF